MKFQSLCLLLGLSLAGLANAGVPAANTHDGAQIVQQIVLIRHGIRAPTKAPEALDAYSAQPWPQWPVAPGQLTEHGIDLMRALGAWHRNDLLAAGIDVKACNSVRVIADSTPRNHDSAAAMLQGLAPECAQPYYALASDQRDPLFSGVGKKPDDTSIEIDPRTHATLAELQRVLLGCDDDACIARAQADDRKPLLAMKPDKALGTAGSLSENLMLEYVQGLPSDQVAWGKLDEAGIARIVTLHNADFAASDKPHARAQQRGGNLLAHVAATFAHTANAQTALPSLAANGERAVVLLGHDTDLAVASSLLDVDWHDATAPDDYPPGGALIYQLVETGKNAYAVRLRVAMPTLPGLRAASTDGDGLRVATVKQAACGNAELCPLPKFLQHVHAVVSDAAIDAGSGSEPAITP